MHHKLLQKWNKAINLVSPKSLNESWSRHILDSVQVFQAANSSSGHWVDIGTGGGFPGLVCAILATELKPDLRFTLVESDKRKCAFLTTVARETGVCAEVRPDRIESLPPLRANIVSARALAPLNALIGYAAPHLAPDGMCLFQKGERYREEVEAAEADWSFKRQVIPSITDQDAVILVLGEIERA